MKLRDIILKLIPFWNGPDREDAEKKAEEFKKTVTPPDEVYLRLNIIDSYDNCPAWKVIFNAFSSLQECLPLNDVGSEVEVIQYKKVRSMKVVRRSNVEEIP